MHIHAITIHILYYYIHDVKKSCYEYDI